MMVSLILPFLTSKYGKIVIVAIGIILLYFVVRYDAYNDGVADTKSKYETAILIERKRISKANLKALSLARKQIEVLNEAVSKRDDLITNLTNKAQTDINANRTAIGVDSVRRINRIR